MGDVSWADPMGRPESLHDFGARYGRQILSMASVSGAVVQSDHSIPASILGAMGVKKNYGRCLTSA
jgi:hypothetical protein